ncbi:MAG: flagellar protein FlaG, partial [Sterolibacterium sp.]|nr:flagellar protein FlaG [Sterolibacterium sp.]
VTTLQASAVRAAPSAASVNPDPDSERLEEATRQVAEAVQSRASNLVFSLDDDSGRTVVKIIDAQTDELIRQIPSEEILALAKAIEEYQGSRSILLADQA